MIEVICGVIVTHGRILLTQRRPEKSFPFTWENPGGKVDGNESHHDALRRELREELGVETVGVSQVSLWRGEFPADPSHGEAPHRFVVLYRVSLDPSSRPTPREGQGLGWFMAYELAALKLAPACEAARRSLIDLCEVSAFGRER